LPDETFDVFLSHNSKDKPVVRQIAEALRDGRGLKVWLDEWELPPGRPWQDELDKVIRTARSAAVLVGKDGLGPWEMPEMRACLSQMVKRGLPVIPVLLPDAPQAPDLPVFLSQNTWVDLRGGITEEGLDRLQWGITGRKPTRKRNPEPSKLPAPAAPRIHNLPSQSLGDLLKGRDQDFQALEASLTRQGQATAITQTIHGLGGIGKTRLAVEYAWRSGVRYDMTFFVVAESREALHSGLASLVRLGLPDLPRSPSRAQEEDVFTILTWFREHSRWLLILDNADTPEAVRVVREILPQLANGHVLITSRRKEWPAGVKKQALGTLTKEKSVEFLLQRTEGERSAAADDLEQAGRLAESLDGLPLALEQAAAYINHHQMSFAEYLENWERERADILSWHDENVMQYPASVAATWQTTLRQLSPTATAILRLTAYLAPDPIPTEMFEEGEEFVKEGVGLLDGDSFVNPDPQSIKTALAELASYSMVTRKDANFTVHRIVQEVLRSRIQEEQRRSWIELSLKIVNRFSPFDADDVRTWPVWDVLRPHASLVVQYGYENGITLPTTELMHQLALFLKEKALFEEAEPLIRRALQINEGFFGPQHPKIAGNLNNLAGLLRATNRSTEAESLMRRVRAIVEDSPQLQDKVALSLNNLASLLEDMNRLEEAEALMQRALQIDEQSLGPQHPAVARDLNNVASLLRKTNRLAEAEPLMRHALQIDEDSLGPQHLNVARDLNNLGMLLKEMNRLAEAEPLMRRAVNIYEQSLGNDHPRTQTAQRNLKALLDEIASQADPPSGPDPTEQK
jgi:tetratricopeptide (TPR) repeat protein